jgi:uncharacterized protein YlxP (DUF503 family)
LKSLKTEDIWKVKLHLDFFLSSVFDLKQKKNIVQGILKEQKYLEGIFVIQKGALENKYLNA